MIRLMLGLIRAYQRYISVWTPAGCRFEPTCSNYTLEALHVHGAVKGSWLGFWRVCRCQPLFAGGYDPVPPRA